MLTHELDAVTAKEWRIFPGLSRLEDDRARFWFVALHVPLFAILLAGLLGPNRAQWILGFDVFAVAHAVPHILLHRHPKNGFRRTLSWFLIGGASVFGTVDLVLRSAA